MKTALGFMLSCLAISHSLQAAEPDACKTVDYAYQSLTPVELRTIGNQCTNPAMENLYYYRAEARELDADFIFYQQLDTITAFQTRQQEHGRRYRMFVALVEAFAQQTDTNPTAAANQLNQFYARATEIARLRLKGYRPRADWLEAHDTASHRAAE